MREKNKERNDERHVDWFLFEAHKFTDFLSTMKPKPFSTIFFFSKFKLHLCITPNRTREKNWKNNSLLNDAFSSSFFFVCYFHFVNLFLNFHFCLTHTHHTGVCPSPFIPCCFHLLLLSELFFSSLFFFSICECQRNYFFVCAFAMANDGQILWGKNQTNFLFTFFSLKK